ncbi:hypothetical protein ACBI99_44720 [Nonomuraea sp. ATR24]|uniref:hypothetical protein n=1 Tax=Nonomuraea sp. ATR24 TaxID=1676744 RepID=UPI0035BF8C1A
MAYATADELAVLLGRGDDPFSEAETTKANLLLAIATGDMDRELGQSLTLSESTAELDGTGTPVLLLPRWPVTAVASVSVIDDLDEAAEDLVADTDYRWSRYGKLRRLRSCWPCIERAVEVTYTAGWDPIPDDIKGMCLRLAQAGWSNFAGAESERLGDWSVKWHVPGMNLSTSDLATLGFYRART